MKGKPWRVCRGEAADKPWSRSGRVVDEVFVRKLGDSCMKIPPQRTKSGEKVLYTVEYREKPSKTLRG